jgi:hypothetical protein
LDNDSSNVGLHKRRPSRLRILIPYPLNISSAIVASIMERSG